MGIPFGYVFVHNSEERAQLRKETESSAQEYRQEIQLSIADPIDLEDIVDDLHLDTSCLPAFAIRESVANLRYPMNESKGPFDNALKAFVQDYLDGKLQPTINQSRKSRSTPSSR